MKRSYRLTITQEGPAAEKDFKNVIEGEDQESLFKNLSRCFRDLNRNIRVSAIKSAKYWIANPYDIEKRSQNFIIKYDVFSDGSKFTVYHWEFFGINEEI